MMTRAADPVRFQQWRRRLARFAKSRHTVADFCRAESVSPASFYRWKRRLAEPARPQAPTRRPRRDRPTSRSNAFRSVLVTPAEHATRVRITLPGGAVIELGHDMAAIEQVVDQVLGHRPTKETDAC